jgi:glycosyltransferase involved in cell wall biosynthesis
MSRLSVVVITRNEEHNLPRCLGSVSWADEIIVLDNESTDNTRELASSLGAQVYTTEWRGYGPAKQEAVNKATGDWVLSIDADEEVSAELAEEIKAITANGVSQAGFLIPRRTRFLGRWIYHCGWYPDPVLRLFRREAGNFSDAVVHEGVELEGEVGRLKHELLHYSYPTLETYFEKFNRYTTLAAEESYAAGKRAGWYELMVRPVSAFLKHYFLKRGFLDGLEGFLVSALSSSYVLVKYSKLRDLARRNRAKSE